MRRVFCDRCGYEQPRPVTDDGALVLAYDLKLLSFSGHTVVERTSELCHDCGDEFCRELRGLVSCYSLTDFVEAS